MNLPARYLYRRFTYLWRPNRQRRRQEGVELLHRLAGLPVEGGPGPLGLYVVDCGRQGARLQPRADVWVEVVGPGLETLHVNLRGLRQQYSPGDGYRVLEDGHGDLRHHRAELPQHLSRGIDRIHYLLVDDVVEVVLGDADAYALEVLTQVPRVVLAGALDGRPVAGVVSGDDVHDKGVVSNGPRHGADGVQAVAKRIDTVPAHETKGRLQTHDSAGARGYAYRAPGVAAQRPHALARRHGRPGAAAGTAGHPLDVPRIMRGPVVRVLAGAAQGELVHLKLAHQHRAGSSEALHDRGIVVRHEVPLDLGANGRAYALRIVEVFQSYRNAVQGASMISILDSLLGLPGGLHRLVR